MKLKTLHFYAHTFCRYFIATVILSYAFGKILGTQFVTQPSTYDKPIGLLNGFELTWYYYGYSFWYGIAIALSQIISAILLFFRKTTRIGVVLFLSFMINILMLNFAYSIDGAKIMASLLCVMALFIFFSEYSLFFKYFIEQPPFFSNEERPKWVKKFSSVKWIYIPLLSIGLIILLSYLKDKYMGNNQFYGTWQNNDNFSGFDRLSFEAANSFSINNKCSNTKINEGMYTFTKDSIFLKSFTKDYKKKMKQYKINPFSKVDSNKKIIILKGKYTISKNLLDIQIEGNKKVSFKRIR